MSYVHTSKLCHQNVIGLLTVFLEFLFFRTTKVFIDFLLVFWRKKKKRILNFLQKTNFDLQKIGGRGVEKMLSVGETYRVKVQCPIRAFLHGEIVDFEVNDIIAF
jgi:hypothetical protein